MRIRAKLLDMLMHAQGFETRRLGADIGLFRRGVHLSERLRDVGAGLLDLILAPALSRYEIDTCLDVGANEGQFAQRLRQNGYPGTIVSFEPVSECYERLRAKAASDPDWQACQVALGERDGTALLHVATGTNFSSLLEPLPDDAQRFGGRSALARTEEVEIRKLETVLPGMGIEPGEGALFLKCDTQGNDHNVFAGLGPYLDSVRVLLTELSYIPIYRGMTDAMTVLEIYLREGFELAGLYPICWDFESCRVVEADCLMVRAPAPVDE